MELLLPHSGLGPDVGLESVMARGKVSLINSRSVGAEGRREGRRGEQHDRWVFHLPIPLTVLTAADGGRASESNQRAL